MVSLHGGPTSEVSENGEYSSNVYQTIFLMDNYLLVSLLFTVIYTVYIYILVIYIYIYILSTDDLMILVI